MFGLMGVARRSGQPGGASPQIPSGAIGVWYADQYVASPRKHIPNEITKATVTPSANLLSAPRRLFNNSVLWSKASVTCADDAATAPDGSSEASTCSGTGNWLLKSMFTNSVPAGTYTVAINAKRNTGADQSFCFSKDNTSTRSSVMVATSAWQRFSYTFTLASPVAANLIVLCSIDGSTAANLQICDFELYSGSSDLGPQTYGGHLYLGETHYDTKPTATGGELNLSTGGWGLIQWASTLTVGSMTAIALVSKVAAGSIYQAYLSKVSAYASFSMMTDESNTSPTSYITSYVTHDSAGLWRLLNKGYHAISHRYNGVSRDMGLDDMPTFFSVAGTVATFTLRDMFSGLVTSLSSGLKVHAIALYDYALTDAELKTAYAALAARAVTAGLTVTPQARVLITEGDSITAAALAYPYVYGANASPTLLGNNVAVSSAVIGNVGTPNSLYGRAAAVDAKLPTNRTGRRFILSVMIGRNDLLVLGTATYLTNLAAYLDDRRAAGWTVLLNAVLPSTAVGYNTARNTVNATMAGWVGTHCDYWNDWAGSTMDADADASDAAKYGDGTHPTTAGQILLEGVFRTVVDAIPAG